MSEPHVKPSQAMLSRSFETRLTRVEDSGARLEKEFSGFREEVKGSFSSQNKVLENIDHGNQIWREQQLKSKQTNWGVLITLIVGILGFMFTVGCAGMGILWMVISMQEKGDINPIKETMATIRSDVENSKKTIEENRAVLVTTKDQNITSIKDRDDMRRDLYALKDDSNHCMLQVTNIIKDMQEQETQMKKAQDESNLMSAQVQRKLNEFQSSLHDLNATMPPPSLYPFYFPQVPQKH